MKKVLFLLLFLLIAGASYYWYMFVRVPSFENCIEVVQPARNPITKKVRFFGNPCQVPIGWEKIKGAYQLPE